ncbi:MAG: hydroxyisourate hydrolase [Acidiphilium sp.]|nr:hydroxyisourate hydrolase [Acidiphilium sp.]MDD4936291.1 hydroxyisourate hydrolase [Acidiphilium sp.]
MAGRLTTHVLDTVRGTAAAFMAVRLHRIDPDPALLLSVTLDAEGRAVLLAGEAMQPGIYEIVFAAGAYRGSANRAFLGDIPVRFGIETADQHYHVPLILSGFGYSTYRGG